MSQQGGTPQAGVRQYGKTGIELFDAIARQAHNLDAGQLRQLENPLITGWERTYTQIPSLAETQVQSQRDTSLDGRLGFEGLSSNAKRAMGALYVFCKDPASYIGQQDQTKAAQVLGQVLPD